MARDSIDSSSIKVNKENADFHSIDRSDEDNQLHGSVTESAKPTAATSPTSPSQGGTTSISQPHPPPPPNGGLYAWTCTGCCLLINAHTWGLNSSYGVFLAYYLANNTFGRSVSSLEYAFVGGLSISLAMLVAPLATLTTRYFGTRITLLTGVFFETLSLIAASFATQIWHLFLSQGVCFGVGMGFLFVGSVSIVPQYFTTKRSLANGIAAAGSGLGGLTYSLAAGAMLRTIGLAWTFRVLAIVAFTVNTTCALIIRDRNKIIGSSQSAFAAELFTRVEYLLLCAYAWFSMLAYVVLIFSLPNYGNAIGLSASQASVIGALLNLGQALGRPPIGYFSDSLGRINMAGITTFLAGFFCFVLWVPANTYGVLIAYVLIGGTVAGTFWTTIAPVMAECVGLKHVPSALNLMWLVIVLPVTFSEAIALEIVDHTGSYLGTQLWAGFMFMAAALCLLALRGWKIGELEAIARLEGQQGEKLDPIAAEAEAGEKTAQEARIAGRRSILGNFWRWRKV
jgi:MFS family permease